MKIVMLTNLVVNKLWDAEVGRKPVIVPMKSRARLPTQVTKTSDGGSPADWDDRYTLSVFPVERRDGEYRRWLLGADH
jgi:hypothetical protein